ncbi:MAG: permease-like cell division protein FtsX [Alistipes sp.]|nr:permease-like cell division protein FtsX [Alistipes sp.]
MSEGRDRRIRRKVRRSYVISTISIALVLFMLGSVSYVALSAVTAASTLRDSVVLSVEVADSLTVEQHGELRRDIERMEGCESVAFMSKHEKLNDEAFRRQFEVDLDLLLGENPLYDSYEVTLGGDISTMEAVAAFVEEVEMMEGVEYVAVPPVDVIERMHTTITHVSIALVVFVGVLLVISLILLNNTIRLAIYSKRYLINTMKLVGATKWYIMRPLLGSALKQGVIAGIIAGALLAGIVYGAEVFRPEGIAMLAMREVGIILGALVALGVVITVMFSAVAVNKFVNMKSNKIYLY